ncbi:flagellar export protein FliJ [Lysobacter sp. N42]|jgi:flagellar FliJ protein|uniref:flagellar export protein FliJ n=1 Tax=Lysobacter sp. N42 TaxID=2545719 RepID=UPI0010504D03|nr:flagellar export protein FliJ [Lysobacter sp. N42]TCZ80363.1 flagellar export protein FliJ [Lysobacter sp. N42]
MPPRSQRLDPILRIKQRHQDEVAQQVAAREAALAEQEQRLAALQRYAAEYSQQPLQGGITNPALLANRLAFQEKLQQAVHQQAQVVDRARQSSEVERARLMLASREKHVLEKLAASYRADEARTADARVQKELDDLGARRPRADAGVAG